MEYPQKRFSLFRRVLVIAGLAVMAAPRVRAITLVQEGKPQASIVVAMRALAPAKEDTVANKIAIAAHDLQEYIEKISGARLPIVGDDRKPQGSLILVGKSRLTEELHLAIPDGLTPARREEGFVIVSKGDRLLLTGNDQGPYHGTEYATYAFLERLGVRWFMPGVFGEVVPRQTTLQFSEMTVREKPDFIMRNWWDHTTPEMAEEERRWKIRNRMNPDEMYAPPGDSSVREYTADPKEATLHPEYFAKNLDGAVNPYLPNLINPQAVDIAAEKMKARFRQHPDQQSLGIAPDDGLPRDFNPQTQKLNQNFTELGGREGEPTEVSISEEWFRFVNALVRQVKQEFPDRILTTNGYANRDTPPEGITLDPNLSIMSAAIWCDTLHAFDDPKSWQMVRQGQNLQHWTQMNDKVWVYGYDYTMLVSALTPVPTTRKLARDLPLLKKWGIIGFWDETRNIWAECGIPTKYLRARLEWDTRADVKALLGDFFSKWYGAAATPAQPFWEDIEAAIESTPLLGHEDRILPYVYTPELLGRLKTDIEAAERAADSERTRLHVQADRLIYEHLVAYCKMNAAEFAGDFAAAAREADHMMELRQQLNAINSFYIMPTEKGYETGVFYWGVTARADYDRKLADMTSGKTGDLIALLPERADFHLDPTDTGRFAGWYASGHGPGGWTSVLTTRPFYAQGYMSAEGYPYTGYLWYRFQISIPESVRGKRIVLFAPAVETEAWAWVNGKYVGHRPYHEAYERPNELALDVTDAIQPGKTNLIAIRVNTSLNAAAAAGGLVSRLFLYSPK